MDSAFEEQEAVKNETVNSGEGQVRLASGTDDNWPVRVKAIDRPTFKKEEDSMEMSGGATKRKRGQFGEIPESKRAKPTPKMEVAIHVAQNCLKSGADVTKNKEKLKKECPVVGCCESFASEEGLASHMESSPKPLVCGRCFTQWPSGASLRRHYRSHTGEKPFHCGNCPFRAAQSGDLTIHLRTHTGEMPFGCTYCGKHFSSSSSRRQHVNAAHKKLKKHACSYCPHKTAHSGSLRKHPASQH